MKTKHQVVIVGGGPVGVGLAVELGQRGIQVALIERRTQLQNIPKGQNLTQRTLEHFFFWNCVDEIRKARVLPPGYPIPGVTAYGDLMSEYWYAPPGREVVRRFYSQDNERLPQYATEKVLRWRMGQLSSVESRMGWVAEKIEQDASGVRVTVAQQNEKREVLAREVLEAEYVVGCDGGHSMVRETLGIPRSGADHDQKMVLAVFRSKELHEGFKRFPERSTYRAMDPALKGYWQFFGRIDVGEGWFFHAPVPNDATEDTFDFHGLLQKAAGFKFKAEFDHLGFWDLRISVAEQYQVGRGFIAGDAAHSHPPYGGFGLNNGLEDATNLGWKLAAKLNGYGGDTLLASYSDERRPIFFETGSDYIEAGIQREGKFLATYDPKKDEAAFKKAWDDLASGVGGRMMQYEPNYEGSPVVFGPPGGKTSATGVHAMKARAGHHLTPQPLSSGTELFARLGPDFTLLAFGAEDGSVAAFQEGAQKAKVPLTVIRDSFDGGREQYEAKLILVRPDQYVVWTGDSAPIDTGAVMRKVAGQD